MDPLFTAGAGRALNLAAEAARRMQSAQTEAVHLLWALLVDESRASDILETHGVATSAIHQFGSLPADLTLTSETNTKHPESDDIRAVLLEARRQVALLGRHVEVGSEHLLWGLATVESPIRDLLHKHGVHPDSLSSRWSDETGLSSAPLATDQAEVRLALPSRRESDAVDTYRLLDAAANRAREGLRVIEDYVRFTLDDAHLTAKLKHWRHEFAQALRTVEPHALLASRDTLADVGTGIHTRHEERRETLLAVVQANFKRVQEAARTLEECGKVLSSELGRELGTLRYELYTLEKAVLLTHSSRERLAGRNLYLLVTEDLCRNGSGPAIRDALANGVGIVQIREKRWPDRKLLEHAHRVREWTAAAGALFIMNDRPDLALLADADGVHVGQDELSVRDARRIVGPNRIVGVSTHTIEQARQAVLDGADYIGIGPVFPTATKSFEKFAGLEFVRQVADEITLPAFAIGGITAANITEVIAAGANRVAVSSGICSAADPGQVAREMAAALQQ